MNIHRSGVVDPLGDEITALQVTELKADTGGGDHLAGRGVLFHHIDQGGDGCVVDDIAVNIRMSLDVDFKGGQQLRTFFAGDLFYDIGAVGQVPGYAEAVRVNGNEITLRFIGGIIGAVSPLSECFTSTILLLMGVSYKSIVSVLYSTEYFSG